MKKKIIAIISAVVAVLCISAVLVGMFTTAFVEHSVLGAKLYRGDRITADLHIYVDSVAAEITKEDDGDYEIIGTDSGVRLLQKTNEEKTYEYNLLINGKYKMKFSIKRLNWWEVLNSDVTINIDSSTDSCFVSESYNYTTDNPIYRIKKGEYNETMYDVSEGIEMKVGYKD